MLARLLVVALAVLGLAVLAGCGDDDDSSGSTDTGGDTTSAETSGGGEANADVADKEIGWVDVVASSPLEQRWINAFKYAADQIGWTVEVQDAVGDQRKALDAERNFINSGVDAVVNSSIAAEWIRPVAQQAKSEGIPLVNLITQASPGVYDADIDEDATEYTQALADKIKEDFPDGTKVGILHEGVIAAEQQRLKQLKEQFEGSNIEVAAEIDVPIANQPSSQKSTVDMMNANPDIGAIIAISGVFPQYVLPGLRTANKPDVKVYSWYADTLNQELMQRNPQFVAVVDSDITKASFIAVDELLKAFSGETPTEQQNVDVEAQIITKDDLDSESLKSNEGVAPYSELIQPYMEQWKSEYGIGS